jgi:hypothetical protein
VDSLEIVSASGGFCVVRHFLLYFVFYFSLFYFTFYFLFLRRVRVCACVNYYWGSGNLSIFTIKLVLFKFDLP